MGKRRSEEYYLEKLKKLREKKKKARRHRSRRRDDSSSRSRHRSRSSSSSDCFTHEPRFLAETPPRTMEEGPATNEPQPEGSTLEADIIEPSLGPEILDLLGDAPEKKEDFGRDDHRDVASRWSEILISGLNEQKVKEILEPYKTPANLLFSMAPVLNPEVKAAINENVAKRDHILMEKQNLLGKVVGILAALTTSTINELQNREGLNEQLKSLSDAGRLLAHIHFTESKTRKLFVLPCLNREIKDTIKDLKRDKSLFSDLTEKLKSVKAISKTGAEMKQVSKARTTAPTTNKALNWRGPPPPSQPTPCRAFGPQTTTTGGRRPQPQQQHHQQRRTSEKRPSKSSRPTRGGRR